MRGFALSCRSGVFSSGEFYIKTQKIEPFCPTLSAELLHILPVGAIIFGCEKIFWNFLKFFTTIIIYICTYIFFRTSIFWYISMFINVIIYYSCMYWTYVNYFMYKIFFYTFFNWCFIYWIFTAFFFANSWTTLIFVIATTIHIKIIIKHFNPPYLLLEYENYKFLNSLLS